MAAPAAEAHHQLWQLWQLADAVSERTCNGGSCFTGRGSSIADNSGSTWAMATWIWRAITADRELKHLQQCYAYRDRLAPKVQSQLCPSPAVVSSLVISTGHLGAELSFNSSSDRRRASKKVRSVLGTQCSRRCPSADLIDYPLTLGLGLSSSIQALGLIECASLIYDEGLQHGAAQIARNRGGLGKFLANPLLSTKSRAASSRRATRPPDSFEIRTPRKFRVNAPNRTTRTVGKRSDSSDETARLVRHNQA